jgi:uncharacterized membrane protein (DUF2068 family)
MTSMKTHVQILAWLNMAIGGLGVLLALLTLAGSAALQTILLTLSSGEVPAWVLQFIFTLITGILLVLSLPCLVLGWGLYNFRKWARILGLILSAISLLNFPIGTAVGVYGLWVLLKPETEVLFK